MTCPDKASIFKVGSIMSSESHPLYIYVHVCTLDALFTNIRIISVQPTNNIVHIYI